jgi:hypothetical protein
MRSKTSKSSYQKLGLPPEQWRCALCGHEYTPAAFDAHRGAFPEHHPLRRCADPMEMTALGFERRLNGSWAIGTANTHPAALRRLATVRQELEHFEPTGEVLPHERVSARGRVKLRQALQAAAAARRRQFDRLRKRYQRKRARNVPLKRGGLWGTKGCADRPPQLADSKGRKPPVFRDPRSRVRL